MCSNDLGLAVNHIRVYVQIIIQSGLTKYERVKLIQAVYIVTQPANKLQSHIITYHQISSHIITYHNISSHIPRISQVFWLHLKQPQKYTVPMATAMGSGSHPQQWNLPVPAGSGGILVWPAKLTRVITGVEFTYS
jgi:hypothetical protein